VCFVEPRVDGAQRLGGSTGHVASLRPFQQTVEAESSLSVAHAAPIGERAVGAVSVRVYVKSVTVLMLARASAM
jgi:hypothetical protein